MELIKILKHNKDNSCSSGNPTKKFNISEWELDIETSLYKSNITHNFETEDIIVEAYDSNSKYNELVSVKILDKNSIEVSCKKNEPLDIIVIGGEIKKIEPTIGAEINDSSSSKDTTYSSEKIDELVSNAKPSFGKYSIEYNPLNETLEFKFTEGE